MKLRIVGITPMYLIVSTMTGIEFNFYMDTSVENFLPDQELLFQNGSMYLSNLLRHTTH